jgi:two-component system osmolarity sensor histidine kinase EnvZ
VAAEHEADRASRDSDAHRKSRLAGLSHGLRTPLARMRLALKMRERRPDPAWMARLDPNVEEMNRLTGDLLDPARGLGREPPAQMDLARLLEERAVPAREAGPEVGGTLSGQGR